MKAKRSSFSVALLAEPWEHVPRRQLQLLPPRPPQKYPPRLRCPLPPRRRHRRLRQSPAAIVMGPQIASMLATWS